MSDVPALGEPRAFEFLLNAMERAAHEDTPADHGYAEKRRAVFEYVAQLVALATGGAEMRDALRRVGIGTSDECGDAGAMVEWFATTEQGEQGCGTLDAALATLTEAAKEDGRREAATGGAERTERDRNVYRWALEIQQTARAARNMWRNPTMTPAYRDDALDQIMDRLGAEGEKLHAALMSPQPAARSLTPERPADAS